MVKSVHDIIPSPLLGNGVRTPLGILKELTGLLATQTSDAVFGEVTTVSESDQFFHVFKIKVPALGGFTYDLFRVFHGMVDLYPVTISSRLLGVSEEAESEEKFLDVLGRMFQDAKMKNFLASLLAQVA